MKPQSNWLAYAALVVAVLGITWSAVFVRWAGVSGPVSAFYRVLIAAAVLLPWRASRRDLPMPPRRVQWLALAGGAFFGFDLLFFNIAVLRTTGATAVLLASNAPVFVGLGTWLLFHRRPAAAFWYGLTLALTGCAGIVAADTFSGGNMTIGDAGGDVLALMAAVFFAAYLMATERVRGSVDTLTFSTLAIIGSVVTLFVVCILMKLPLTGYSMRSWASLAGLGLISQLTAYFAVVYALGHLPATVASVGLLAQVPLTALLFVPVLGEPLSAAQMVGGILVVAGIYVVNRA